jgi:hypothetical protein
MIYTCLSDGIERIGGNAFFDCTALRKVQLSDEVASIGIYAFGSCNFHSSMYYNTYRSTMPLEESQTANIIGKNGE